MFRSLLTLSRVRQTAQALFLLLFLFLFLQTETKGGDTLGRPVRLFLDTDPLLFLSTLLGGRVVVKAMLVSLVLLGATALLGRFFCGWICPLGTLNNLVGSLRKSRARIPKRGWFAVKYILLAFLLGGALVGVQFTGIFDPLSLLTRCLTVSVYPALNQAAGSFADVTVASSSKFLSVPGDWIYTGLKKSILAFAQPYHHQAWPAFLMLGSILAANLVEKRFWCRYLCPLGALLGVVARWAPVKREAAEGCNGCGACDRGCQGGTTPSSNPTFTPMECYCCGNCDDGCPKQATTWRLNLKPTGTTPDVGRRAVLLAGAAGVASAAVNRSTATFDPERPDPGLIRPPGALDEPAFLARCIKCGACMKACPTNALQPASLDHGLEALWTPVLVPKAGWCEYNCTLCGQVCPTGALQKLNRTQKHATRIGTAMFDKNRCLPWAHTVPCIVCEEHCPTPTKSIYFEEVTLKDRHGNPVVLKQPKVDLTLCTGCGICEAKCPIQDKPGVVVTSVGESRSKRNQLILEAPGGLPY